MPVTGSVVPWPVMLSSGAGGVKGHLGSELDCGAKLATFPNECRWTDGTTNLCFDSCLAIKRGYHFFHAFKKTEANLIP